MPLLKDLCHFYTSNRFDIVKWEETCKRQKIFMDEISRGVRSEPQYFRVAFFGMGFPNFVRVISSSNEYFSIFILNRKCF